MKGRTMERTILLSTAVLLAGLAGCEEKFTQRRFDTMVRVGQTRMEVQKILGEPNLLKVEDTWKYRRWDKDAGGHYGATIRFDEIGRVLDKAWWDAKGRIDDHPDSKLRSGETPVGGATVDVTEEVVVP
jgi:hypothetical protein